MLLRTAPLFLKQISWITIFTWIMDNSSSRPLVPKTTHTQDNSHPTRLVPKTTRTKYNSYPKRLVPRTIRAQGGSYPRQLVPSASLMVLSRITCCFPAGQIKTRLKVHIWCWQLFHKTYLFQVYPLRNTLNLCNQDVSAEQANSHIS